MRHGVARDANEPGIVRLLRRVGCLVQHITQGKGVPDLLVWSPFLQKLVLLEVKDPGKPLSARELTPAQKVWHKAWAGVPVFVVETAAQAAHACGVPLSALRTPVALKAKKKKAA